MWKEYHWLDIQDIVRKENNSEMTQIANKLRFSSGEESKAPYCHLAPMKALLDGVTQRVSEAEFTSERILCRAYGGQPCEGKSGMESEASQVLTLQRVLICTSTAFPTVVEP